MPKLTTARKPRRSKARITRPDYLAGLDQEQYVAATQKGKVLVVASAGSGKSLTLLKRIQYLISELKVDPSRILVASFNRKAAKDLYWKLSDLLPPSTVDAISISTLHGLFRELGLLLGNTQEKWLLGSGFFPDDRPLKKATLDIISLAYPTASCDLRLLDARKSKYLPKFNLLSELIAHLEANEPDLAVTLKIYHCLKGDLPILHFPDLEVPSASLEVEAIFGSFVQRYRPQIFDGQVLGLGGYDDILRILPEILARDPAARQHLADTYDHVLIDECQDLDTYQFQFIHYIEKMVEVCPTKSLFLVGDDKQCVESSTPITTPDGVKPASEIKPGSRVLSWRNGTCTPQVVTRNSLSSWCSGPLIKTIGGRKLHMSPSHKIWARLSAPGIPYFLYCKGQKAFLGLTPGSWLDSHTSWRLGVAVSEADANTHLQNLSSRYGISVVNTDPSPSHLILDLLKDLNQDVNLPASIEGEAIRLHAHLPLGSQLVVGGSTEPFNDYRAALAIVRREAQSRDLDCIEDIEGLPLVTASTLLPGDTILALDKGSLVEDLVSEAHPCVTGEFYDLDVQDAANFFGGDILSHNCIYDFRGARLDTFKDLYEDPSWKVCHLSSNYRCSPSIIEAASKLIRKNGDYQLPFDLKCAKQPEEGDGVHYYVSESEASNALATTDKIKDLVANGASFSDISILCRTNNELDAHEICLLMAGIPVVCKESSKEYRGRHVNTFMSYLDLILVRETTATLSAIAATINAPNRLYLKRGVDLKSAVKEAADRTLKHGLSDTLDGLQLMSSPKFLRELLKITRGKDCRDRFYEGLLVLLSETVEVLKALRNRIERGKASIDFIFTAILRLKGSTKYKGAYTSVTLVESMWMSPNPPPESTLPGDLSTLAFETKDGYRLSLLHLGGMHFLYELAKSTALKGDIRRLQGLWADLRSSHNSLSIDSEVWDAHQMSLPLSQRSKPNGVSLGTIHSTKGLEWSYVFAQMPQGVMPHEPKGGLEDIESLQSERRLGYVMLSRAKNNLFIISPRTCSGRFSGPSSFVKEAGVA